MLWRRDLRAGLCLALVCIADLQSRALLLRWMSCQMAGQKSSTQVFAGNAFTLPVDSRLCCCFGYSTCRIWETRRRPLT